jgi:phage/plasmid-associated DNA primase
VSKSSYPIADIAARLNEQIVELAHALLGQPNQSLSTSSQLRYCSKGSIAIEIDGPKRGQWFDHEQNKGGAGLELISHELNLSNSGACEWALDWLGLSPIEEMDYAAPATPLPQTPSRNEFQNRQAKKDSTAKALASKVAEILSTCTPVAGTAAERYLHRRGITASPPDALRYRPFAFGNYGALVVLATDANGQVLATQQIYVTEDGQKAPVKVIKRTNKAIEDWSKKAAVRFPGKHPIILTEGPENALSDWQSTGNETWACLGVSNIGHAPLPEKAPVIIARDGDLPGSKADIQIRRVASALARRGHSVSIATPPVGKDFNDLLCELGADAVRALIDSAQPFVDSSVTQSVNMRTVLIGSDVEIAKRVHQDLSDEYGEIIHAEGEFWRYGETHWEAIPEHEMRLAAHVYDGAFYETPKGEPTRVKLGKSRVDSILFELVTLVTEPKFFMQTPVGINCASGFIRLTDEETLELEPHDRSHRCRHTLPGHWHSQTEEMPPEGSLLARLLNGVFQGDFDANDKILLLAEVCGSAALGYATRLLQPKAIILKGERAENGKSQIIDLARGLLPPSAISSITAARIGDERHVIGLVGKLLNASDELSSAAAIASETFKLAVTGEPIDGRDVYKSRVEFRSVAQHIFATNTLPPFQGGMDRGVQRRLLVLVFNRTIPMEERIEGIGRRIAEEEADLLLAWAIGGAIRLIRQSNLTIPPSSKLALTDWIFGADPVLAWLDLCVEIIPVINESPSMPTRMAYEQFRIWAIAEGFKSDKLPAINGFVQRIHANAVGIESKRTSSGRVFLGISLKSSTTTSNENFWQPEF